MPIPNSSVKFPEFASVEINGDIFLARLDFSTRFSFVKSSVMPELGSMEDFIFPLTVKYKNKVALAVFEQEDILSDEIVLGTFVIDQLGIKPTVLLRFPF